MANPQQSLLDAGTLATYLTPVKSWLDANPSDVLSLLIVNNDDLPPSTFGSVFSSVGLDSLAYSPPSASALAASAWPTLGEMIDTGKRLVVFMDFKADYTEVPYIVDGECFFLISFLNLVGFGIALAMFWGSSSVVPSNHGHV